ncbi:MAG: hypothetical protein IJA44_06535 [Clostridia bacterium]|nr:hypothetical protein [Clostridia bacterium]
MELSRTSKICFFIIWFAVVVCLVLMNVGNVSITYSGFGVDSAGVLYVGKEGVIEKYDGDKMVGTISPQTSRGYAFTVKEDDTILLSTADMVYTLDLSGKVLDKWEDEGTSTFNDLQFIRKFIAKDGCQYTMKLHFGRTIICSGEDVIYKMPMLDYIVRILLCLCFIGAFVFAIALFKQWLKEHNNKSVPEQTDKDLTI